MSRDIRWKATGNTESGERDGSRIREDLEKLTRKPVRMKIIEIHRPELEPALVAESLGEQLKKRMN